MWSAFTWPKTLKARLFLAFFGFFIIILAAWLVFRIIRPAPKPIKLAEIIKQNKYLTEDNDNDGLKNWEEEIYGTDPNNPDTDGDGTNDGDEIKQGRDPLKKGPDDKIAPNLEEGEKGAKQNNYTQEFTDRFIKEPVAKIILGEKPTINKNLIESYTDKLLSHSILDSAPTINEASLKKGEKNTLTAIQNYLNSFKTIWDKNIGTLEDKELDITITALQTQNYDNLPKIEKNIIAYQKTIDEIKLLFAPASVWDFHVGILNFLYKIKLSAELMKDVEKDPLKAMLAVKDRLDLNQKLNSFLENFQTEITKEIQDSIAKAKIK